MPAPLNIDREKVRMLVLAVGCSEAARRMGIPEPTVRQWSCRGKWLVPARDDITLAAARPDEAVTLLSRVPPSIRPVTVTGVTQPGDALRDSLAEDDRETRLSLSRAGRRLAKEAEGAPLEQAGDVLQVAKLAAITHRWDESSNGGVTLQFFSITGQRAEEGPIVDV